MSDNRIESSRVHDLAGTIIGIFALSMLAASPWQVDTSGPEPFYKGPLIFPLIVFCIMLAGALPSMWRLFRPDSGASWTLDGYGHPVKNLIVLGLLVLYLGGLVILGLEVSTWVFLAVCLKLTGQETRARLIFFPAGITLTLFLVFKVFLDIWFPQPLIMEWLGWG